MLIHLLIHLLDMKSIQWWGWWRCWLKLRFCWFLNPHVIRLFLISKSLQEYTNSYDFPHHLKLILIPTPFLSLPFKSDGRSYNFLFSDILFQLICIIIFKGDLLMNAINLIICFFQSIPCSCLEKIIFLLHFILCSRPFRLLV